DGEAWPGGNLRGKGRSLCLKLVVGDQAIGDAEAQSFLRPDVVWFGESLPHKQIGLAIQASRTCNLFISAGTSSLVYPAASLPEFALANGATLLEINPQPTPLTPYAHFSLRYPAGQIFLLQALQSPPN
ncbi:MAG: Sir2 family NAD-dependent protein deacetylase, partial [Limisphaerales bacterium]